MGIFKICGNVILTAEELINIKYFYNSVVLTQKWTNIISNLFLIVQRKFTTNTTA